MLLMNKKGAIAFLTIDNPEKRNVLTPSLLLDIDNTLKAFLENDEVRCVVITGSGNKAFSSGYDISAIPVAASPNVRQNTPVSILQAFNTLKNFPYPTIAMLNGSAFGAGLNLCACCDIRIAADDIKLGMTAAKVGVAYHPEGIQQFIGAFGIARTKEIFFTADTFQGKALVEKGLVDYLVPRQELVTFTQAYAQKITRNAPLSLKGIKKIIAMFENDMALNQDNLDQADKLIKQCFQSDDLKEGQKAFLEKRVPKFKGK
jgi:enoyl-CoA hydratase/carnithine racemase